MTVDEAIQNLCKFSIGVSVSVLILAASVFSVQAQAPASPTLAVYPDLTPTVAAGAAVSSTLDVMKGNIGTTFVLEQNNAGSIASLNGQIVALQAQLNSQAQTISAMQAQLTKLTTPAATTITLSWSTLPDGPLNGLYQGVNFGTGFWCVASGELKACADGQPQRAFSFPQPVKIVSFTFSTTTTATTGIMLTAQAGQQNASAATINQDSTFTPGWVTGIPSFTVSASPATGSAPDLRIRQVQYQ